MDRVSPISQQNFGYVRDANVEDLSLQVKLINALPLPFLTHHSLNEYDKVHKDSKLDSKYK